jgi:hypothetical protein
MGSANPCLKAFMLPGDPLLLFQSYHSFWPHVAGFIGCGNVIGKAEKLNSIFSRLDALRD